MRTLRALRPLRAMSRMQGMRVITVSITSPIYMRPIMMIHLNSIYLVTKYFCHSMHGLRIPQPPFHALSLDGARKAQENSDLPFNRLHSSLKIVSLALGSKHVESTLWTNQDKRRKSNAPQNNESSCKSADLVPGGQLCVGNARHRLIQKFSSLFGQNIH